MATQASIQRLLLATLVLQLIGAGPNRLARASVSLFDDKKLEDAKQIESVASVVCDSSSRSKQQIGRISTVLEVGKFLSQLPPTADRKLQDCAKAHLESIKELEMALTRSNGNVCSGEKVGLIERYHNSFVTTHERQVQQRREQNKQMGLPKMNLFFEHYAMEVSAMCQTTLINNLERDVAEVLGEGVNEQLVDFGRRAEQLNGGSFGPFFERAVGKFMNLFSAQQYDDVLLIWDILSDETKSTKGLVDPKTGERIVMFLKTKSDENLLSIQDHCRYKLKPIYSKLVLPVIQLANLGYSNKGERFQIELNELRSNQLVKRWYAVTQLCEALLPIKSYRDPAMESSDIVVLTQQEAEELEKLQPTTERAPEDSDKVPLEYEPQSNTMEGVDLIESVTTMAAQKLVNDINLNQDAHDRQVLRIIGNLMRRLKSELKTKVHRFFFPRKNTQNTTSEVAADANNSQQIARQDLAPKFVQSLEEIDEEELMNLSGGKGFRSKTSGEIVLRQHRRQRRGDLELRILSQETLLQQGRTKTFSEIIEPVREFIESKLPTRTQMIIFAVVVIGVLAIILAMSISMGAG